MSKQLDNVGSDSEAAMAFAVFLESTPPGVVRQVTGLTTSANQTSGYRTWKHPAIELFCDSDVCQGIRYFDCGDETNSFRTNIEHAASVFLNYSCRHCRRNHKSYALFLKTNVSGDGGGAIKYGELPDFGPPTPSRVISLIREEREYFIRGRTCEFHGMGIAAFAYYRRVVENQKVRLIGEIEKVAKRLGANPETIRRFEQAKGEQRFAKAVEDIKDVIPPALLIEGHNPLGLLHNALSDGLHNRTDAECLELATNIRVVLTELAERMEVALKEDQHLKDAVRKLADMKRPPSTP